MTTFISPKPHEKAAWHAAARRSIANLQAQADARNSAYAKAVTTGYTHSICSVCSTRRTLAWAKGPCGEFDASTDDRMCPGIYRAAGSGQ
jgi:hypothetical protein